MYGVWVRGCVEVCECVCLSVFKALLPDGNGQEGLTHKKMQAQRGVCLSAHSV